ncbi:MAG: hypothetical protein K0U60_06545 [Actinomycetia bacterium]|nr:hypothetical protein [Actinomycetes bacterium]MCH9801428.1 hypothetical protein [Actinomycetes bacterium]
MNRVARAPRVRLTSADDQVIQLERNRLRHPPRPAGVWHGMMRWLGFRY